MTKRPQTIDFVECYRAIFNDWLAIHPTDRSETERDLKRIALEYSSRGLPFFTMDLPAIGKALDASLAAGRLLLGGLPHTRKASSKTIIPRFLKGFWSRVFDEQGLLIENIDPTCILFLRTILYLGKKVRMDCAPRYVINAVKEYYDVERILPLGSPTWDATGESFSENPGRQSLGQLSDRVSDWGPGSLFGSHGADPVAHDGATVQRETDRSFFLDQIQSRLDRLGASLGFITDAELKPRHGPGAVSETAADGYKYNFPTWNPRLEEMFPFGEWGVHSLDAPLAGSIPVHYPLIEESTSRLIAVPKTQKGPRLIASEPICNQWMQQAVAGALREHVARSPLGVCIDFFDQTPSQEDALKASRTGSRGTIDLSSASDRLSLWLVQRVFRSNKRLLDLLRVTRTLYLKNPTWQDFPSLIKLKKFASMGSALTFPVQSIVFAMLAAAYGSTVTGRSLSKVLPEVRVFGDDIIIPVDWVEGFSELLETLYLKVNRGKTFWTGKFRESCGMDAFQGTDVTPAYLRPPSYALATREALGYLDVVNNLFIKGFWHLSTYLERTAPWSRKLHVVNVSARAFGLVSFCKGLSPATQKKVRWNEHLHRYDVEGFRLISKKPRFDQVESWNALTSFFTQPRIGWGKVDAIRPILDSESNLAAVINSSSRMPALVRRTRVPLQDLVG